MGVGCNSGGFLCLTFRILIKLDIRQRFIDKEFLIKIFFLRGLDLDKVVSKPSIAIDQSFSMLERCLTVLVDYASAALVMFCEIATILSAAASALFALFEL